MILILIILCLGDNASASLINNGSFESGLEEIGLWTNLDPSSTSIDSWTVINSNIDYNGSYWEASDGERSLDLNGSNGPGGIEQSFTTVIGQEYLVSFDIAGNPSTNTSNNTAIKWLRVAAAGDSADFSFDIAGNTEADMGYETKDWTFIATATSTNLQFISLDSTMKYGPVLDNVIVTAIPEPASLALLCLGGVSLALRRKFTPSRTNP
ncbi:MAG: choice-of-anchor C family protein [Planctomycetes bacterium]|nr:choice-of-anchor C family protein [Planctomycetota bacterium]